MSLIQSQISTSSDTFKANEATMRGLVDQMREKAETVSAGDQAGSRAAR
jgi:hypothetical protein